ncbi:hypothetical protein BDQ17DRAFT_1256086, partial [Cyathus striatus]
SAERSDAPKCHPKTRTAVINNIMSWVDSKDLMERIMWLHGPAGSGKTTIVQTVAERCDKENKLVSSFFFSRNSGRDDGYKLVATIASQMVIAIPATKEYVVAQLKHDSTLLTYSMENQMQKLVIEPLQHAMSSKCFDNHSSSGSSGNMSFVMPHLITIDGLDECKNPQVQSRIINMIAELSNNQSTYFQFIIASRPELEIRTTFNSMDNLTWTGLVLDDHYDPDKDIETYLQSEFSAIMHKHILKNDLQGGTKWPSKKDLSTLVRRSSGQFIYASTIMKYISNSRRNPKESLCTIINLQSGESLRKSPYTELDELYRFILIASTDQIQEYDMISPIFQVLLYRSIGLNTSILSLSIFLKQEHRCT